MWSSRTMTTFTSLLIFSMLCFHELSAQFTARPVSVSVNVSEVVGPWNTINTFFGCDEPNYAYYPKGQALLKELGARGKQQTYFRAHNLLTTGHGSLVGVPGLKFGSTNAYTEDADGNPVFNFTIIDAIFDAYLAADVKPYIQVGFMPRALATDPNPYFFDFDPGSSTNVIYTGWSHTPKSYERWEELVYRWATHCLERYGEDEVRSWYWEVWNEPNIRYWNGTSEEFYKLHDHAINGIKRAIPQARVGGCEVAGGADGDYLQNFLDHCLTGTNYTTGKTGTPLDFISFHAKGAPTWVNTTDRDGYVRMNVSTQLRQINEAFKVVALNPQRKPIPIIMGEYDPDSCAACQSPAYGYRNGLLYPAYTAASFMRAVELAQRHGVKLQGAITWAFEYEQTALSPEEMRFFDGFRVLSTMGIDKPVLNVHRMLGMMEGQQVVAESSGQIALDAVLRDGVGGGETDVGVVATSNGNATFVFLWHYHDEDLDFPDANVKLHVTGLSPTRQVNVTHWRIDAHHSNAFQMWVDMGSPQPPNDDQYEKLVQEGKLALLYEPRLRDIARGGVAVQFSLPVRSLSLLRLDSM